MNLPDVAIGAIGAAILAGTFTVANLVSTKESKTSEFRQKWIDELRNDVAELVARASILDGMFGVKFEDRKEIWESSIDHFDKLIKAAARIRMRLNQEETESKALLDTLLRLEKALHIHAGPKSPGAKMPDQGVVSSIGMDLLSAANIILKNDWKRVKRGEPRYQIALYGSLAVLLAGFFGLLFLKSPN